MIDTSPNIIDSQMSSEEILTQNPKSFAPQDIVDSQEILPVTYCGFDGFVHAGQIVVHKNVISDIQKFFEEAFIMKFPIEKVIPISNEKYKWNDEVSCDDNNSAGYNYRLVAGTTRMSKHATGLAIDINPVQNIYIKYDEHGKELFRFPEGAPYDEDARGTLTTNHPLVILMKELGWEWGGDWTADTGRTDYQHFEKNM